MQLGHDPFQAPASPTPPANTVNLGIDRIIHSSQPPYVEMSAIECTGKGIIWHPTDNGQRLEVCFTPAALPPLATWSPTLTGLGLGLGRHGKSGQ